MQWTVIGGCLAALLTLGATKMCSNTGLAHIDKNQGRSVLVENDTKYKCTFLTKQRAFYFSPQYSPEFKSDPVTSVYTTFKGIKLQPLRDFGGGGIYQATMLKTRQNDGSGGSGGYFGVQWRGSNKTKRSDSVLISLWNKGTKNFPMHDNCKLNCHDCGKNRPKKTKDETRGTSCSIKFPGGKNMKEGEEVKLTFEREAVEDTVHDGVTYKGHVWKLTALFYGVEEVTVGRILIDDKDLDFGKESKGGITGMSMFHEHLGCNCCGSFAFEVQRGGPYVTKTATHPNCNPGKEENECPEIVSMAIKSKCGGSGGKNLEDVGLEPGTCTCYLFNATSDALGSITLKTGSGDYRPNSEWLGSPNGRYIFSYPGEEIYPDEEIEFTEEDSKIAELAQQDMMATEDEEDMEKDGGELD